MYIHKILFNFVNVNKELVFGVVFGAGELILIGNEGQNKKNNGVTACDPTRVCRSIEDCTGDVERNLQWKDAPYSGYC